MKKDNQHNDYEYCTGYTPTTKNMFIHFFYICVGMMVEGIHLDKDIQGILFF